MNIDKSITNQYSTWLEIDQGAIAKNVRRLTEIAGRPVMAVVKGNGYGHGLCQAGQAAVAGGAAWLGVARIEEAFMLREDGITAPVLVLGYCPPDCVIEAAVAGITLTVFDLALADEFEKRLCACEKMVAIHAKFDTGMGRLGVQPEDGLDFLSALNQYKHLSLQGMFTHFSCADAPLLTETADQIRRFGELVKKAEAIGRKPAVAHASNSAATLYFPQAKFDLVRSGIAIYGLQPSPEAPLVDGFEPALTWKTRLISVKTLPPGHGVGYNLRYVTKGYERIGVIPAGYADGIRRRVGNFALVGGQRVPVSGGMCMDMCMLQLDTVPDARPGDEVVLLGSQGAVEITAEELGKAWNTVNYDVVCGLTARVPRVYKNLPER